MNELITLISYMSLLLEIPVFHGDEEKILFEDFENEHCFSKEIQPMLTSKYLNSFITSARKDCIYEIKDPLGINILIFHLTNEWVLLGPYVENLWDDVQSEMLLASFKIPISLLNPYKLYRCRYTLTSSEVIIRYAEVATSFLSSQHRQYETVTLTPTNMELIPKISTFIDSDSKQIQNLYNLENELVASIKEGNIEKALKKRALLHRSYRGDNSFDRNLRNQISSATILRTLARKAVEEAGVPLLILDSISKDYAQKMYQAKNIRSLNTILERMIRDFTLAVYEQKHNTYVPQIQKAVNYIIQYLSQPFKIDDIAKTAGLSTSYLSTLFKKETGFTISAYITHKRIEKATRLLKSTSLPIQNVASYVGYNDNNYFTKVFKKHMGMTPSDFRMSNTDNTITRHSKNDFPYSKKQ